MAKFKDLGEKICFRVILADVPVEKLKKPIPVYRTLGSGEKIIDPYTKKQANALEIKTGESRTFHPETDVEVQET